MRMVIALTSGTKNLHVFVNDQTDRDFVQDVIREVQLRELVQRVEDRAVDLSQPVAAQIDETEAGHLGEGGAFQPQYSVVREIEIGDGGCMQQILCRPRVVHVLKRITGDRKQTELRVVLEGVWMDVLQTVACQVHGKQVRDAIEGRAIQLDYACIDDGDRFQLLKTASPQSVRSQLYLTGVLDAQVSDTWSKGLLVHQFGASMDSKQEKDEDD